MDAADLENKNVGHSVSTNAQAQDSVHPSKSKPKGLSRIKAVRKIVDSIIKRARLEITELHIFQPDTNGLCAHGKIRVSHMGTGPLPLVGLTIKFKSKDDVFLRWNIGDEIGNGSETRPSSAFVAAHLDPITLQQGSPGSATSAVGLRIVINDAARLHFVDFVRRMVYADPENGVSVQLCAKDVQIKAYGLKFGGLALQKEVALGGLGALGGILSLGRAPLKNPGRDIDGDKHTHLQIADLDIKGGDAERGIEITASVTIKIATSKPRLIVEPGSLRFALCVFSEDAAKATDGPSDLPRGLVRLGNITLAATTLQPGPNKVQATGFITFPNDIDGAKESSSAVPTFAQCTHAAGKRLIASILQNESVSACAIGLRHDDKIPDSGVSDIGWLADAFEGTRIDAIVPPLGERVRILDGAEVRVEDHNALEARKSSDRTSQSQASSNSYKAEPQSAVARATLRNSFGADILVHNLTVRARSTPLLGDDGITQTLELGTLSSPESDWDGLLLKPGRPTHVSLPMEINPDPKVLVELLRKSARSSHVDLGSAFTQLLDEMSSIHWTEAGFEKPPKADSSYGGTSRAVSTDGEHASTPIRTSAEKLRKHRNEKKEDEGADDLAGMLTKALANLRVTAHISADVTIGKFRIPGALTFKQRNLPIALSTATSAHLLPLVGKPFIQALIDRAQVDLCGVDIKHMHDRGIEADLSLRLKNFGPLSAQVDFIDGLQLRRLKSGDDSDLDNTVAVIHFLEPLAVLAGDEDPVMVAAKIVPPTGPESNERFSTFIGNILNKDEATYLASSATVNILSGGVQFDSSFEKEITVDGLGGLRDLSLENLEIRGETVAPARSVSLSVAAPARADKPTAIEISASINITNPGSIRILLQKIEVSLAFEDVEIGQASIEKVDIQAYRTVTVKIKGVLYAPEENGTNSRKFALERISRVVQGLFRGEKVVIQVKGRRGWVLPAPNVEASRQYQDRAQAPRRGSTFPVSLAWLDDALREFRTTATLQWKDGVNLVTGIDVGHLNVVFPARELMQLKIDSVTAAYELPFPISFKILDIKANLDVLFQDRVIAKCQAAQDSIEQTEDDCSQTIKQARQNPLPLASASRRSFASSFANGAAADKKKSGTSGTVRLALKQFDLITEKDAQDIFGDMISEVFESGKDGTSKLVIRGSAQIKADTVVGEIDINIPLGVEETLNLEGLDGFRHAPLKYDSLEVSGATSSYISLSLNAYAHNPSSSITVVVPDSSISLAAYYDDAFVGDVVIGGNAQGITLLPGSIELPKCEFRYHTTSRSEPKGHVLISDLFEGRSAELSIRGHSRSAVNSALAQALAHFDLPITIRPLGSGDIIERIQATLGLNVVTSNSINAFYVLNNPLNLDIDILKLEVHAKYQRKAFASATRTYSKEGKVMPIKMRSAADDDAPGKSSSQQSTPPRSSVSGTNSKPSSSRASTMERLLLPARAKGFQGALVVKLEQPLDQLVRAFLQERGSIMLDVELIARLDINGYDLQRFVYQQRNVPLVLTGLEGVARLMSVV